MAPPQRQAPRRPSSTGSVPARRPSQANRPVSRPASPPATLTARAGPAEGQSFPLDGDELVIGRSADNPVSINDTSVSRKHALVRKTPDGWALSDLGSGNGTLLNGEPLADETALGEGDVITLGDTELEYSAAGATAEAQDAGAVGRRAPVRTARTLGRVDRPARGRPVRTSRQAEDPEAVRKKKRKILLIVGGVSVVMLAALVGGKAISQKQEMQAAAARAQLAAHQLEMATLFKEAKSLVRQGDWEGAQAKLREMQETDPEYEPKQVENYLSRAANEIPAQKLLSDAAASLARGELALAHGALAKVKTTTQEAKLAELKSALDARAGEKIAEGRQFVSFASDLAKMEQLVAMCDDILVVRPDDRETMELKKQALNAIERIKNPSVAPVAPDTPWLEVQQRFRNGDAAGALSLAQACANKFSQCRAIEAQIKEFESKSKRLEDLSENDLVSLYQLDKKIAGGQSSELSKPVRTQLVSKLFVKASQAKTTQSWQRAIDYARKVLEAEPSHPGAQSILSEARNQAKDVYLRGYQLKETSPDEALRLFKEVLSMTPKDDETHQKAQRWITELSR